MEKLYNTTFIVDISQNPDEVETVTSRIQQLIEDHGGVLKRIDRWGKRRMAYSIDKKTHGFYVEIEFSANSRLNIPKILQNEYRLNDRVLRSMTYIVGKKELTQRSRKAVKSEKEHEIIPDMHDHESEKLISEQHQSEQFEVGAEEKPPEREEVSPEKKEVSSEKQDDKKDKV